MCASKNYRNTIKNVPRSSIPQMRKEQILEVALQLFSTKGANNTTNQDIAKAAGLASPGLIYHYFKDRNDLLRQVIVKYHPMSFILSAEELDGDCDLKTALYRIASIVQNFRNNQPQIHCFKILIFEILKDGDSEELFATLPQKIIEYLNKVFTDAKAKRLIIDLPTDLLICNFAGSIMYPLFFRMIFNRDMNVNTQQQVDLFLKNIYLNQQ